MPSAVMFFFHSSSRSRSRADGVDAITIVNGLPSGSSRQPSLSRST